MSGESFVTTRTSWPFYSIVLASKEMPLATINSFMDTLRNEADEEGTFSSELRVAPVTTTFAQLTK